MNAGLILYVEDSKAQRDALELALELRGFAVVLAGDVTSARNQFKQLRGKVDVVVLDMRLEDPEWPQLTGADVAIEFYNPQTPNPPEFLINSAYSEVDYFKLAMKLGTTTYLDKSADYNDQNDLVRHIRALTIRRVLNLKHDDASERVHRIVESSLSRSEALLKLCREELEPAFSSRLGAPFVLLISEGSTTFCYDSEGTMPEQLEIYKTIQSMMRPEEPLIIDVERLFPDTQERVYLERLNNAAFIPLTIDENIRLSIGVLQADKNKFPLAEDPFKMASVLARHVTAAVVKPFLVVLRKWSEHDTKRKESMRITSGICLPIGRSQLSVLHQLKESFPQLADNDYFRQLQDMVEDLQITGSMLESLAKTNDRQGLNPSYIAGAPINKMIESEWKDLDLNASADSLSIHGQCQIAATPEDLSFMISSVLQLFAQRVIYTPSGVSPHVTINCRTKEKGSELIFEDRSARLDKYLREQLLAPFAALTPSKFSYRNHKGSMRPYSLLFLTKMLLEVKYNGMLEDISDNESSETLMLTYGHKFRMYFPHPAFMPGAFSSL